MDTGWAGSPLPEFGVSAVFLVLGFTVASPRGVATATHPFCLPSVEGACKVMLPCRLMAALPCGQYTVPFAATTGVSPMTVNDSACGAPPIVPTCSRVSCGPLMLSTAPSEVRYPYTVPLCVTAIFPPDETPASTSLFFALNRAALRSFSEVIHTVPSSSCTCRCVTELTMNAPAMMPSSRSSMTIGVIHRLLPDGNSSLRIIDPKRN